VLSGLTAADFGSTLPLRHQTGLSHSLDADTSKPIWRLWQSRATFFNHRAIETLASMTGEWEAINHFQPTG